ncbi:hypothetical protein GCM10020000_86510 [Streptomyces olivoverticillatus]
MQLILLFVCIQMTVVALWRLPALRYSDPLRRALWGCAAGLAVALWARFPPVKHSIDSLGITDLSALVKDFSAIAGSLALLNYAVTSYGVSEDAPPRRIAICRRVAEVSRRATVVVIPLMLLIFFIVVDRSRPSHDFAADHAGQVGPALFMTLYYLYPISAGLTCGYQWSHVSRRAETRTLRIGLALGAAFCWLFAAYAVVRTAFMWVSVIIQPSLAIEHFVGSLSDLINALGVTLFASGASLPTTGVVLQRWKSRRMLWRLHPLRKQLLRQFPELTFQPTASRLREATRLTPPLDVRVDRAVQEIGDAVELLRHYVPAGLWLQIEEATEGHPDNQAAAEAYWIAAGLRCAQRGRRSETPAPPLPSKSFTESSVEGQWLERVQRVHSRIDPTAVDHSIDLADQEFAAEGTNIS